MKKSIFILITLLLLSSNCFAYPNEPKGFRKLTWGQSLNSIPPERLENITGDFSGLADLETVYRALEDDRTIGGADSFTILYHFWNNKLENITAYTYGRYNFEKLVKSAKELYGPPAATEVNPSFYRCNWHGEKTDIEITYLYERQTVVLSMQSLTINKARTDWDIKNAKNNQSDNNKSW